MKSSGQPKEINTSQQNQLRLKVSPQTLFSGFDHGINWKRVFCSYFQSIPNWKTFNGIDGKKLSQWLEATLDKEIVKKYSYQRYKKGRRTLIFEENLAYILAKSVIIYIEIEDEYVEISFDKEDEVVLLVAAIRKFAKKIATSEISLVVQGKEGFELKPIKNKKLSLKLNETYNDDLLPLHKDLLKSLKHENKGGLVLLHGLPGTGKSTYIRYLTASIKKEVIFLSPRLAGNLDDPGFVGLLVAHPNSIIIIEDAEELLVSRNTDKNSGISTLLNLTDGLLGTSLGIQFICTFNTPVTNIDKALLRKGRLMALYEFGPLSIEKSRALLAKLGTNDFMVSQPMTLAELYHVDEPEFQVASKRNPIGFSMARVA